MEEPGRPAALPRPTTHDQDHRVNQKREMATRRIEAELLGKFGFNGSGVTSDGGKVHMRVDFRA